MPDRRIFRHFAVVTARYCATRQHTGGFQVKSFNYTPGQTFTNGRRKIFCRRTRPGFNKWQSDFPGKGRTVALAKPFHRWIWWMPVRKWFDLGFYKTQRHPWNLHQAKGVIVTFALKPHRFAIMFYQTAVGTYSNGISQTVSNEMRTKIMTKSVSIFKTCSKSREFITRFEKNKWNIVLP